MVDGVMKGQFIMGQNPVVGAVNSDLVERGLAKLDWLVVRDFAMTETANFWQKGRLVQRGELRPEDIGTEVFFLPSAMSAEKEGSMTNTQPPRAVARQALRSRRAIAARTCGSSTISGKRLKQLYADSTEARDAAIQALTWTVPGKRRNRGTGRGGGTARDQRLHGGGPQADRELPAAEGRRQHGVRRLDVFRHLSSRRP